MYFVSPGPDHFPTILLTHSNGRHDVEHKARNLMSEVLHLREELAKQQQEQHQEEEAQSGSPPGTSTVADLQAQVAMLRAKQEQAVKDLAAAEARADAQAAAAAAAFEQEMLGQHQGAQCTLGQAHSQLPEQACQLQQVQVQAELLRKEAEEAGCMLTACKQQQAASEQQLVQQLSKSDAELQQAKGQLARSDEELCQAMHR